MISHDAILDILRQFKGPDGRPLDGGTIDGIAIRDTLVQISLLISRQDAAYMEALARAIERRLVTEPGVHNATVVLTAEKTKPAHAAKPDQEKLLPNARFVIAVASGKGGVGKSTAAVNLAVGLARIGLRVGLVDADIHGPSLARMLGRDHDKPEVKDHLMIPIEAHGVACMSMGFLVPQNQAMIWRGPMVMGALQQILGQTDWGPRDIIVVDLPPGTGDAQLTLSQRVNLAGAVIISTPQDIALIDARRGVAMFEKIDVPILGLIENMSYFHCPHCGERSEIFGHGGAAHEAATLNVPFLGEIPLRLAVRQSGDAGAPVIVTAPDDPAAIAFQQIAATIWQRLIA